MWHSIPLPPTGKPGRPKEEEITRTQRCCESSSLSKSQTSFSDDLTPNLGLRELSRGFCSIPAFFRFLPLNTRVTSNVA